MAPDPMSEPKAQALSEEVRELKQLLAALQAELKPALQSSLRERSEELQRLGGELSERDDMVRSLKSELDAAGRRAVELEQDVERWRARSWRPAAPRPGR